MQMINDEIRMSKEIPKPKKIYDLCERTECFAEEVIEFSKNLPVNSITRPLIEQLVRAATSVGANYCEADDAFTKKDFIYRIGICRKESKESRYWLKIMLKAVPEVYLKTKILMDEAKELNLIFSSIVRKSKK